MATEANLTRRIIELERRMDLLSDHLEVEGLRLAPQAGPLGPGVRALPERGDRLGVVALSREQTGTSLAEAKRTIEQMVGGS